MPKIIKLPKIKFIKQFRSPSPALHLLWYSDCVDPFGYTDAGRVRFTENVPIIHTMTFSAAFSCSVVSLNITRPSFAAG